MTSQSAYRNDIGVFSYLLYFVVKIIVWFFSWAKNLKWLTLSMFLLIVAASQFLTHMDVWDWFVALGCVALVGYINWKTWRYTLRDWEMYFYLRRFKYWARANSNNILDPRSLKLEASKKINGIYTLTMQTQPGYDDAAAEPLLKALASDFQVRVAQLPDNNFADGLIRARIYTVDVLAGSGDGKGLGEESPSLSLPIGTKDYNCKVGLDRNGDYVEFPLFSEHGGLHISIAGKTGSGKNSPMSQIMFHSLAAEFKVWVGDGKATEFGMFRSLVERYEDNAEGIVTMLENLIDIEHERQKHLQDIGKRTWEPDRDGAPIVCIIDEISAITSAAPRPLKARAEAALIELTARGRSVGISLVVATQQLAADVIPTAARSQMSLRVGLHVADTTEANMAIPGGGAEPDEYNPSKIPANRPGEFVCNGIMKAHGRFFYINDEQQDNRIKELTK